MTRFLLALLGFVTLAVGPAAAQAPAPRPAPGDKPAAASPSPTALITMEKGGEIVLEFFPQDAPKHVENFVKLVNQKFYDGQRVHRVEPNFVVQFGDPQSKTLPLDDPKMGSGGPGYTIKDDPLNGTYHRGTVAMARTGQPDSQGSQFFIVLSDDANAALTDPQNAPYPYAILGEVTSGMDVADTIAAMPNSGANSGNQALDPVVMTSVTVADAPASSASPAATSAAPAASQ